MILRYDLPDLRPADLFSFYKDNRFRQAVNLRGKALNAGIGFGCEKTNYDQQKVDDKEQRRGSCFGEPGVLKHCQPSQAFLANRTNKRYAA